MNLPKMAPLKWGCRGVWGVWRAYGVSRGWYGKKEGTPAWDNTYQIEVAYAPILLCGIHMREGGPVGESG